MHAGASLSRRFTLLRPYPYDLPGVDRWLARDERRSVEVHVDLVTVATPDAIRHVAVRAAQVRDIRFARVLATGREMLGGKRVTYIVTEAPQAVSLTDVLGQRIVPAHIAAAIIGEAAHALEAAAALSVHHGYVRPEAVHVLDTGRVIVSGLGTDGELAARAGLSKKASQKADAQALARLYVALVTGKDAAAATEEDLPEHLALRAANMARATIAGDPPGSLAAILAALGPVDSRGLRDLSHTMSDWPWAAGAEPAPLPPAARLGLDVSLDVSVPQRAAQLAALGLVPLIAADDVARTIQSGRTAWLIPAPHPAESHEPPSDYVPATKEEAAEFSARIRRVAARDADQELGLDTWERVVADQNRTSPPSVVQAVFEWLHRRWPRSVAIGTAAEQARHRAHRPAPLRTGPVLVSMFLGVIIVAGIVAFEILTAPLGAGDDNPVEPPSHYPEFTFSPEPEPTTSPDAQTDGDNETEDQDNGDE